jgi:hypothetical protein
MNTNTFHEVDFAIRGFEALEKEHGNQLLALPPLPRLLAMVPYVRLMLTMFSTAAMLSPSWRAVLTALRVTLDEIASAPPPLAPAPALAAAADPTTTDPTSSDPSFKAGKDL